VWAFMPVQCPPGFAGTPSHNYPIFDQVFLIAGLGMSSTLSRWRHGFESRWGCSVALPRSAVGTDCRLKRAVSH
jgi:hypothetical protein